MVLRRLKSVILFVLVVVSLMTSYALWHGSWTVHSEVGLGAPSGKSMASTGPSLAAVLQPSQVVLGMGHPRGYTVQLPGSSNYQHWLTTLKTLTLSPLHTVTNFDTADARAFVIFDFSLKIDRLNLTTFVPAINSATFTPPTNRIVLYQDKAGGTVYFAVETDEETFVGTTNLNSETFQHTLATAVDAEPWHLLSTSPLSLVPEDPLPVKQYQCTISEPKLAPLVDSFFVNTQAVTRIRENKGTLLFTDGSRAVQWNTANHQLIFDDPNAPSSGPVQSFSLSGTLSYVRNHGGIPGAALVTSDPTISEANYIFLNIVDGLPILNRVQQYRILLQEGHIVEYDRPLLEISGKVGAVSTNTIGYAHLVSILNSAGYKVSQVQVELGYVLQPQDANTALLEPVYYIYQQGSHVATIDAVNGTVTKGGAAS